MSERGSDATELAHGAEPLSARAGAAVLVVILCATAGNLYFFYSRNLSNLYGDGLAHVEGARRLIDSLNPGYWEIGSAWLPLFHILASPLAQNDFLWRTGLAGSIVSAAAFAVTAWILFRLSLRMNRDFAAAIASLAVFVLCPSMAFLASAPLTESLALMWAVLVVYGLFCFQQHGKVSALIGASLAAFFGTLTRYDGWYLLPFAAAFVFLARSEPCSARFRQAIIFSSISGAGPVLWLLHNAYRFGNPIDFYNGPHSAKALYAYQLATTGFRYPTDGSVLTSARYFLADLTLVIGAWPLVLASFGFVAWALEGRERRRRSAALLFLVPLIFYVQSMAHAGIPIYVPTLFPNTYYNLRYGIEMLPGVAIFSSFLLSRRLEARRRTVLLVMACGIVLGQAVYFLSTGARNLPVVQESVVNNPCRSQRQQGVMKFFASHYDNRTILAAAGKWPCVLPTLGIPLHKTLSESNPKYWKRLRYGPEPWVGWIVRSDGDAVDELMRAYPESFNEFELLERERYPEEGSVGIYRRRESSK